MAKDKPNVPVAPVDTSAGLLAGFDVPKTIGSLAEFRGVHTRFRKHVVNYVKE